MQETAAETDMDSDEIELALRRFISTENVNAKSLEKLLNSLFPGSSIQSDTDEQEPADGQD